MAWLARQATTVANSKVFFVWHNVARMHMWRVPPVPYKAVMNSESKYSNKIAGRVRRRNVGS
jgi:hypothetical protein